MSNYRMKLVYDGTRYDGWQRQKNTERTIQGKLEQLMTRLCGQPVEVQGAGRTDEGVHALGQVANMQIEQLPQKYTGADGCEHLLETMNEYLPEDIAVVELTEVSPRFHSRLSAMGKWYRYRIRTSKIPDVRQRYYVWQIGEPLDANRMEQAIPYLLGTHDFRSFCANKKMKKSTERTITELQLTSRGAELIFDVRGDGFLYHMVRIIIGTLVEVGQGKRSPESLSQVLEAGERSSAGFMAPARGLTLMEVYYRELETEAEMPSENGN